MASVQDHHPLRLALIPGIAILFVLGAFFGFGFSPLHAGQAPAHPASLETSKSSDSRWGVQVSLRLRPEFRENLDFKPTNDFDGFWGQQLRLSLRLRFRPGLSGYLQLQDVHAWGAERDDIIYQFNTNVRQFYLDWQPRERFKLRLGRQELNYGNQRLIGAFGWDTVGRTFDGMRLTWQVSSRWSADAFGARLVEVRRGTPHRVGNQDIYGLYTHFTPKRPAQVDLYALYHHDGLRSRGELPGGTPSVTRIYTVGGRVLRSPGSGWRYDVESAWQFGRRGADPHRAAALAAQVGYSFKRRFSPSLAFEYDFATGDKNPFDGRAHEFHNLFPTNHSFYGYADLMGWRNMHDLRTTVAAQLLQKLRLQADYHRFLLASRRGRWSSAGGQTLGFDPTGNAGRDLGQEVDFLGRLPVNKYLQLESGYSVFVPGAFARATRGAELHHFAYVQTLITFSRGSN